MVDEVKNVKIVSGQDIEQNDDMSRAEYLAKMTPEQRKQLEELKQENSEALKANACHRPPEHRPEDCRPGPEGC